MIEFVTTVESSGIDRYSQELAKRTRVSTIETRRSLSLGGSLKLIHDLRRSPCLLHLPSQHFARYGLFLGKPFIITVHDVVRMCFPFARETVTERLGLRLDALGLRRARHTIAVSNCTKVDLVRRLNIPESRITCNVVTGKF